MFSLSYDFTVTYLQSREVSRENRQSVATRRNSRTTWYVSARDRRIVPRSKRRDQMKELQVIYKQSVADCFWHLRERKWMVWRRRENFVVRQEVIFSSACVGNQISSQPRISSETLLSKASLRSLFRISGVISLMRSPSRLLGKASSDSPKRRI